MLIKVKLRAMTYKLRHRKKYRHHAGRLFEQLGRTIRRLPTSWQACLPFALMIVLGWGVAAFAQDAPQSVEEQLVGLKIGIDTMWVVIAAILVIFMNAGFAMLETGFCRQKNAVNILAKNLVVFALATVAFWTIGFGIMFGDGTPFFGLNGFFLTGADNSPAMGDAYQGVLGSLNWTGVPLSAKFLFQVAFAGTAATIVSGAVAERIKFNVFLVFSIVLVAISYAVTGHWVWGGGWLSELGFKDFAGSTVVHSVGGWAALIGAAILGPRMGKYIDGQAAAIPGHNMSIATLGCLILWIGWFGFNPGSTMAVTPDIAHIALTTNMAAATGGIAATFTAWAYLGKPDLSMIINGILAGLVAITAGCDGVSVPSAAIIGLVAGILVVFAVTFFDKIHVDDPVGATSVHLVNGIWGTLAVGLFNQENGLFFGGPIAGLQLLGVQLLGIASIGGFTVAFSFIAWLALKAVFNGIRVTEEEEKHGLDIGEHGMEAYSGFLKDTRSIPGG